MAGEEKLTPKEAIRAVCMNCLGMKQLNTDQARDCEGDHVKCSFFPYRMGKRPPVKVFRQYCLNDCMNGYRNLVAGCTTEDCANHPYRFGKNPALEGQVRGASLIRKRSKEVVGEAFYDLKPIYSG